MRVVPPLSQLGTGGLELLDHPQEGLQQSQYRLAQPLVPVICALVLPGVVDPPAPVVPPRAVVPVTPPEPMTPPDPLVPPWAVFPPEPAAPPAPPLLPPAQRPQVWLQ
jgi:hypothetical protein